MQRLFAQLTFVRHVQIEKLATGVGHIADFSDALFKTGSVASEAVADQLALPITQERACPPAGLELKPYKTALSAENGIVLWAHT